VTYPEGQQVIARMNIPAEPAERSRLSQPGMSTDRIMAAALQIVDTEGSHALTMRRLGQALDRKVMTLYRYVPSKDALLDGVVARVLTDLAINPDAADWRQELRDLATSFRALALAHPHAVPLLVTRPLTRPLGQRPPATLRPLEDFLELLIRAGFSCADALHAYRLFFGFLHGHVLDELQELIDNPDETDDLLRLGLHRLPRHDFPHLRALAPELSSYDGAAHLQQGVELMITGLQSHFRPATPAPPPETAQQPKS
jgi:AcrR family transcriptional regulator